MVIPQAQTSILCMVIDLAVAARARLRDVFGPLRLKKQFKISLDSVTTVKINDKTTEDIQALLYSTTAILTDRGDSGESESP